MSVSLRLALSHTAPLTVLSSLAIIHVPKSPRPPHRVAQKRTVIRRNTHAYSQNPPPPPHRDTQTHTQTHLHFYI